MTTLARSLVTIDGTIRDGLAALDGGAGQIALAVDADGRLCGVLTDGDIRRALLRGATLDAPLAGIVTREPVTVGPSDRRPEVLELMRARRISAIPVVDADGSPIALHLLHEFLERTVRTNWAIVMAGGQGARLRPLTDTVPKPMLRVAGRPILERIVLHLVGMGIRRIFLSINYLGTVIEDHFGDGSAFGATIEYLREERPLGTAGALGLLPERPTETLLLLNGDLVTNANLDGLLAFHAEHRFDATIGFRRYLHTVPFGCIERDGDRVTALDEKPTLEREVNTGMYALEPSMVELVRPGEPASMPDVIGDAIARGMAVGGFEIEDDWVDVGQREQLVRARGG
ncbi:MAG TPA: nucleotidyltransferase family protein [Candidatus Limnocylindrales bacterium]|nr:nucleotidyltransferase family protein [Candidatus Limnocylindrales bacterium]